LILKKFNPNYSYRSFSCKQIPHNLYGIVLKVKQFNFFEPHTCPEAGMWLRKQYLAKKTKFLEVIA